MYNSNDEFLKIQALSHEIDKESFESFQAAEWCQNLQDSWNSAIIAECSQIAAFDPRPVASVVNHASPSKMYYNHINKKWVNIESDTFESHGEAVPEISSAHRAKEHVPGQGGVDIRPHLYDSSSKSHILIDSGSQISAWPPDPEDKPLSGVHLKAGNGLQKFLRRPTVQTTTRWSRTDQPDRRGTHILSMSTH